MAPEISPRRLHPLSPLASTGLAMIRAWPVVLLSIARSSWEILILFLGALVLWRIAVWSRTIWSLDTSGLIMRSGILRRQTQIVPPQRVQQIEIRRGLRHRVFGLAVVRVGLAGSGQENQMELDSLRHNEAVELQRVLELWRHGHATTWPAPTGPPASTAPAPADLGAADSADGPSGPPLFAVRTWHLIAAGLSSRTLWLAPFAAVGGALQLSGDLGRGEEARSTLREWITSTGLTVVIPLALGVAIILAISTQLARNFQFRVIRRRREFILTRGLVEQRSVTVPQDRIQAIQMTANWLRVMLGLASVQIHTADMGPQSSDSVDIPIGRRDDLCTLTDQLLSLPTREIHCSRHPLAAVRREVIRRSLRLTPLAVIVIIGVRGFASTTSTEMLIAGAVGLVAALITGVLAGLQRATGWNDSAIVTQAGFFTRRQWTVPISRIQSVGSSQNPFQRRLGLMTLRLDVAGTRTGVVIRDLGVSEAATLISHSRGSV